MREALAEHGWALWVAGLVVGVRLVMVLRAAERVARAGTWNMERDAAARRARAARVGLVLVGGVLALAMVAALGGVG